MKRAKAMLLIAGMLIVSASGAHASLFGRHKTKAQPPAAKPAAVMSLDAIEVDAAASPRLVLRTSGSPVYTSYSKTADTFIVDLTGAAKSATLAIPATLPSTVNSISADEVTEMGSRFTRVTLKLGQPVTPQAAADGNSIVITVPVMAATVVETPLAAVTPSIEQKPAEVVPEPVKAVVEPVVVAESLSTQARATTLRKIETTGSGSALDVQLATDGEVTYKAFKLEKPARVVVDLDGVKNAISKNTIAVGDALVSRVRVSQFSPAVTRVVIDLAGNSPYHVTKSGDRLHITFSDVAIAEPQVKPVAVKAAVVAPPPPAPKPAASIEQIPVVAESAPAWKMPESKPEPKPARPARSVINAPAAQTPPSITKKSGKGTITITPSNPAPAPENVFNADQPVLGMNQAPAGTQSMMGSGVAATASQGGRTITSGEKVYTGEPVSLNLKDADLKDVIRTFAALTGLNIAVDPNVSGSVTVDFNDVPWDQALDIILHQNGLNYVIDGNVMRVGTISRLAEEAQASRRLAEEERLNVPTQTVAFKLSYARANEVQSLLKDMASPRARIIVDQRTNQLIITEIPTYLSTMRSLIESVDVPTPQVVIEARIVETSKQFIQQYGFNWSFRGTLDPSLGTGTGLVFPNSVGVIGGPFEFGPGAPVISFHLANVLNTFTLDFALNAAETEGLARVISAPRVMTQDNVGAEIQSGFQIPYQTRVNFTTTIAYVDATLRLGVTPQITTAGTVIMDIQVQKNEPATGLVIEGGSGTPLITRQARTRLMVRDGGTTVIAGIYQTKENNAQTRLPFLHQIPVIGALFRTHNINSTHDELLIFITPRIVRST
jgi:type IV pilus assembly protein PilQ